MKGDTTDIYRASKGKARLPLSCRSGMIFGLLVRSFAVSELPKQRGIRGIVSIWVVSVMNSTTLMPTGQLPFSTYNLFTIMTLVRRHEQVKQRKADPQPYERSERTATPTLV